MIDRNLSEIQEQLSRQLHALLSGTLFTSYATRSTLRADDLAIRSRASQNVLDAKSQVERLTSEWADAYMETPTRDNPLPNPASLTKIKSLRNLAKSLGGVETEIRSSPAPDYNEIWDKIANNESRLVTLLEFDRNLVTHTQGLFDLVAAWSIEDINFGYPQVALEQPLRDVQNIMRARTHYLRAL